MQPAEFEEKEYEQPLYNQLLCGSNNLWAPGQVFESAFGIDAAILAENLTLWTMLGYQYPPVGAVLNDYRWGFVWRKRGNKRPLPTFKVNLLIQAKRPDFLMGRSSYYSHHGITGSYWRFRIKSHQQRILEKVTHQLRSKAIVSYASPAFHTNASLFHHTHSGTIVDNSSFVHVARMSGHSEWVYDRPGSTGLACSQPSFVSGPDFWDQINNSFHKVKDEHDPNDHLEAEKTLTMLSKTVMGICNEEGEANNPLAMEFLMRIGQYQERASTLETRNQMVDHLVEFLLFVHLVGVNWFVIS
ncbi:hypothetical protein BVX94_00110 [bacterium B17]|nr:hypothetical protein BVX94_00110 [bacterium B17]